MTKTKKAYDDWRVWILVLLIILVLLWLFYGGQTEEFNGIDFLTNLKTNDKKTDEPKPSKRRMTSQGEEHCRRILEKEFKCKFPPRRDLDWLVNPETKRKLELDGYNQDLGIAFEFQGRQHYHYTPAYHRSIEDFKQQIRRDKLKRELCLQNKVWLIVIPYHISEGKRENFILDQLPDRVGLN